MNEKKFRKLIETHLEWENNLNKATEILECSIFDSPLIDYSEKLFNYILNIYFTDKEVDVIYWWMYEHKDKNKEAMWDKDGNVIPMKTIQDLWKYVAK